MGIKVIIVDMNTMMSSDVCKKVSKICLQEVSLFADQSVQSAFMLACLSAHIEVQCILCLASCIFFPRVFDFATFSTIIQESFKLEKFWSILSGTNLEDQIIDQNVRIEIIHCRSCIHCNFSTNRQCVCYDVAQILLCNTIGILLWWMTALIKQYRSAFSIY